MRREKKKVAWIIFGAVCILDLLAVSRAMWMNIWGLLTAVMGVLPLVGYILSPVSNTDNLSTYEPLDVFESWFDGAQMEIVSRDVLTGTDISSVTDFNTYFRYEEEVKSVCWSSLTVWVLLVLVIWLSVKLTKKRKEQKIPAVHVLIGWTFIALVPCICAVMVETTGHVETASAFYVAGICALVFFLVVWESGAKETPEKEGQGESLTIAVKEERPPEGWYACPTCGRLVREGNRCSRCEAEKATPGESSAPAEAPTRVEPPAPAEISTPVEAESAEEKPVTRYCRKCGATLEPGWEFCTRCGTKVIF